MRDKRLESLFHGNQLPKAEECSASLVDCDTGEVLYSSRKSVAFSSCANGEGYIKSLFDSFVRGLRLGRNLRLEITCTPVQSNYIVPSIFNNVSA